MQHGAWGMYYAEGYNGPTEADMQRLTINDPNAGSFPQDLQTALERW